MDYEYDLEKAYPTEASYALKGIPGAPHSGRLWYDHMKHLEQWNSTISSDPCVFINTRLINNQGGELNRIDTCRRCPIHCTKPRTAEICNGQVRINIPNHKPNGTNSLF